MKDMNMKKFIIILLSLVNIALGMQTNIPELTTPREFIFRYQNASTYEVLQLTNQSSPDDIKKSFRQLALKWHPDKWKNHKDDATEAFKIINNAYDKLVNAPKINAPKILNLDNDTKLNLNQKAPSSNKTFGQLLEECTAENLPLMIAKCKSNDNKYWPIVTTFRLSYWLNYLNLTSDNSQPLSLQDKIITEITYYFVYPNNVVSTKLNYPINPNLINEANTLIFKIIDNLSREEINLLIRRLQRISNMQLAYDTGIFILKRLLSNNNRIDVSDENTKNSLIDILKAQTKKLDYNEKIVFASSLLNSNISNKELIAFEMLASDFSGYTYIIGRIINFIIKNIINSANIDAEQRINLKNKLIINIIKQFHFNLSFDIANKIYDEGIDPTNYSFVLSLYESISKDPQIAPQNKAVILKNIANIWQKGARDVQKNELRALQLYEALFQEPFVGAMRRFEKVKVQFQIASIYKTGALNIEKDIAKAAVQFNNVANTVTHPNAMSAQEWIIFNQLKMEANFELGKIYLHGAYQVPIDLIQAKNHFKNVIKSKMNNPDLKEEAKKYMDQINVQIKEQKKQASERKKLELNAINALTRINKKRKSSEHEDEERPAKKQNIREIDNESDSDSEMTETDSDTEMND